MTTTNGTTRATGQRTLSGAGLANRKYDARQKACVAVEVGTGRTSIKLSKKQLASIFGVSVPYILAAEKLSPEARAATIAGNDTISFALVLNPPPLALRAPKAVEIDDPTLINFVRTVGTTRVLEAAVAVEAAQ
jgi:hypothetical protein